METEAVISFDYYLHQLKIPVTKHFVKVFFYYHRLQFFFIIILMIKKIIVWKTQDMNGFNPFVQDGF